MWLYSACEIVDSSYALYIYDLTTLDRLIIPLDLSL